MLWVLVRMSALRSTHVFKENYLQIQLTLVILTSLISNTCLSRSENLSLPKHENLTTGKKILWKRGEIAPNFSSFPQYFQYISNSKSPIIYIFVKYGCSNYFFLKSANLIRRG